MLHEGRCWYVLLDGVGMCCLKVVTFVSVKISPGAVFKRSGDMLGGGTTAIGLPPLSFSP